MSQLNPDAAEFVPISPTRSIPSPACRNVIHDRVISQSPRRPTANDIDINVPNPVDFEKEVKSRPSDVDSYSNGHDDSDLNTTPTDLMENLLNGKNIDEIPEFQPGSTPSKILPSEEFHFGPNAAPFTPGKFHDQSELSTKAVYGDESTATIGTSFNESVAFQDTTADLIGSKESDPMSMSYYADKGDNNPFDLNEVQILPDNIDEFLKKPDSAFNDTISDLPEHDPLGKPEKLTEVTLNNDDAIQTTDLDKPSYDEEKELESPAEPEKELLTGDEECDFSKTPEPTHEDLLGREFCQILGESKPLGPNSLPPGVELLPTELRGYDSLSPRPESLQEELQSKSPLPEASEVSDLLQTQPESLPRDVELISPVFTSSRPSSATHEEEIAGSPLPEVASKSPLPEAGEVEDLLRAESKSPLPRAATEVHDLLQREDKSPLPESNDAVGSKSPYPEVSRSPLPEVCEFPPSKTPTSDVLESKSPVCGRSDVESPICDLPESKSPVCELEAAKFAVCDISASKSPLPDHPEEVRDATASVSPLPGSPTSFYTKPEDIAKAEEHFDLVCTSEKDFGKAEGDFTSPEVLEQAQEYFDDNFKPRAALDSPEEAATCSLKENKASTESPECNLSAEDQFTADQSTLLLGLGQNIAGIVEESLVKAALYEVSPPKSVGDAESVATADINSFLERSLPPDVASPLSPTEFDDATKCLNPLEVQHHEPTAVPDILDLSHLDNVIKEIDVKTENITLEFPEQTILTPSEETQQEDAPTAPPVETETPVKEEVVGGKEVITPLEEIKQHVPTASPVEVPVKEESAEEKKMEAVESGTIVAAVGAAVAVGVPVAAAIVQTEKEDKKKGKGSLTKRTPLATRTTPTTKVASRLNASSKAAPAKTGTAKPLATTAPKRTIAPTFKARPAPTPKSTERKPLANGDVKPSARSTLTARKISSETATPKPTPSRPTSTSAPKLSPTTTRPATARPASSPRTVTARTTTSAAAKPATPPRTAAARITTSTAAKPTASSTSKTTIAAKTPPRPTTAPPKAKPPVGSTVLKQRAPLTKTFTKAPPDTEKQNKESANKLTASRTSTSTPRTLTSTTRRVESRVAATRLSKTTTTTMKSTTAKKPAELVRHATSKAKTTKIEKPKENGVSTVVTEEITIQKTSLIDSEPQLIKDNSPVDDNKLVAESELIQTNNAAD